MNSKKGSQVIAAKRFTPDRFDFADANRIVAAAMVGTRNRAEIALIAARIGK